ncbi:MAG: DUF1266 domain-containing protein [Flavobacteriales bacterium]
MKKKLIFIGLPFLLIGAFLFSQNEESFVGLGLAVFGILLIVISTFFKNKSKETDDLIMNAKGKVKQLDDVLYKNKTFDTFSKPKGNTMEFYFPSQHLPKDQQKVIFDFDTKTIENQGKTIRFEDENPLVRLPRMDKSANNMYLAVVFPHGVIPIGESKNKEEKQQKVLENFSLLLNPNFTEKHPTKSEILEQAKTNPLAIWHVEEKKQLNYAQAWLISIHEIYNENVIQDFCGNYTTKVSEKLDKNNLKNAWNIVDRESLLAQLYWLETEGHSKGFDRTKNEITAFDNEKINHLKHLLKDLDQDIKRSEKGELPYEIVEQKAKEYFKERFGYGADIMFHNLLKAFQGNGYESFESTYNKIDNKSLKETFDNLISDKDFLLEESKRLEHLKNDQGTNFLIWDMARLFMLAIMGHDLKWLNDNELWSVLYRNGKRIQENYSSWKEMTDDFLEARKVWSGTENKNQLSIQNRINKYFENPQSVWNCIDFKLPFTEDTYPLFTIEKDIFKDYRLNTYELFYGEEKIGTVDHLYKDFLNHSGIYELQDNLSSLVKEYIEFSIQCGELIDYDNDRYEKYLQEHEQKFMEIIQSDDWYFIHPNGEEIKILVPNFCSNNEIVWRWNTIK